MHKRLAKAGFIIVFGLFLFGIPMQTMADDSQDDNDISSSREVMVAKHYPVGSTIPQTITYDKNGWSGVLRLDEQQSTGDIIIAVYKGTVTCSGTCPIPLSSMNE